MVQARASIKELPELLNTGFAGNEARLVENMVADLAKAKDDSQDLQSELRQQIFAIETTMSPIDAMFLYRIVEHMGELARQADAAGTTIQLMLFK